MEVPVAYSHSAQASDLRLCVQGASAKQRLTRWPVARQVWRLTNRPSETQIRAIVHAYLSGVTAAQLAAAHGLSLSSLKRILRSAKATKVYI